MKKTIIIISIVVVLVVAGIWAYNKWFKKPDVASGEIVPPGGNTSPTNTNTSADVVDPNKILHIGDKGNTVKALQTAVNNAIASAGSGLSPISVDGDYGSLTDSRIKQLTQGFLESSKNNVTVNAVKALAPSGSASAGTGGGTGTSPNIGGGLGGGRYFVG
jgi:hypothetical protein